MNKFNPERISHNINYLFVSLNGFFFRNSEGNGKFDCTMFHTFVISFVGQTYKIRATQE